MRMRPVGNRNFIFIIAAILGSFQKLTAVSQMGSAKYKSMFPVFIYGIENVAIRSARS
jgi:hypothetical protein